MMQRHLLWLAVSLLSFSAGAAGLPSKIAPGLRLFMAAGDQADVLVYFRGEPNLAPAPAMPDRVGRIRFVRDQLIEAANKSQGQAISLLEQRRIPFRSFYIVNAVAIPKADVSLLAELARLSEVVSIVPNAPFALRLPTVRSPRHVLPDDEQEIPENLRSIGADRVWNELGVRGAGIVIGGQDTGYAWQHPALRRQYRGSLGAGVNHNYSWHDSVHGGATLADGCRANSPEPCDDSSHGTHTMGSMVGDDGGSNHIGVAPEASWIGCRNMDHGVGTPASYLECFEFFLSPYPIGGNPKADGRPDMAPHVINNSWGCPSSEGCRGEEFVSAVRAMRAAGIMVVAAAGNDGPSCGTTNDPPGSYSGELISVAAYDHRSNQIAGFSSRGPSGWNGELGADLSAPGSMIRSSVPSGGLGDGLYDYKSGTSMASPHMVGAVALLWSARPALVGKIPETIAALERSATPKTSTQNCGNFPGGQVPNAVFGFGLVNAYEAIQKN